MRSLAVECVLLPIVLVHELSQSLKRDLSAVSSARLLAQLADVVRRQGTERRVIVLAHLDNFRKRDLVPMRQRS